MEKIQRKNSGIKLLLKRYRKIFRIPENLNHYSKKDYEIAERKFIKYVLMEHTVETQL
jgi:hypothetical protein